MGEWGRIAESIAHRRLRARAGWGESAIKFVSEGADKQKALATKFQDKINAAVVFLDMHPATTAGNRKEFEDMALSLEIDTASNEQVYKTYVREVLGDFTKMAGIKFA